MSENIISLNVSKMHLTAFYNFVETILHEGRMNMLLKIIIMDCR